MNQYKANEEMSEIISTGLKPAQSVRIYDVLSTRVVSAPPLKAMQCCCFSMFSRESDLMDLVVGRRNRNVDDGAICLIIIVVLHPGARAAWAGRLSTGGPNGNQQVKKGTQGVWMGGWGVARGSIKLGERHPVMALSTGWSYDELNRCADERHPLRRPVGENAG